MTGTVENVDESVVLAAQNGLDPFIASDDSYLAQPRPLAQRDQETSDHLSELLGAPRLWRLARSGGQTGETDERWAALTPLGCRGWPRPILAAVLAPGEPRPGGHLRRAPAVS